MAIVGIVGDLHLPYTHPMYLRFCADTFDSWGVTHIHFAGDIVDNHNLGFWDTDPGAPGMREESVRAREGVSQWVKTFPRATVCIGNHDDRLGRVAHKAGIHSDFIKTFSEAWETPLWDWQDRHEIDGVVYEHGHQHGSSKYSPAYLAATKHFRSTVIGHFHTCCGLKFFANSTHRIFGLDSGCGIDAEAFAFSYSKPHPVRPVLGCGVVVDGAHPISEPMPCGPGERYERARA